MSQSEIERAFPPRVNATVNLRRLAAPKLVWLNRRAVRDDPLCGDADNDYSRYIARLIDETGYFVSSSDPERTAVADRYGGRGVGQNGGSGRAAFLGAYLVKGIGPTPLVRSDPEADHSSGHLYLDEGLREIVFGELYAMEFPFGAIENVALIDAGLGEDEDESGVSHTRGLLVRPGFLRPSHIERAAFFRSSAPTDGMLDAERVRHIIDLLFGDVERGGEQLLKTFFSRWAEQVAYAIVHRVAQTSDCTANICLNGSLVDFGGATSMPSWARAITAMDGTRFGQEVETIFEAISSLTYYLKKFLPNGLADHKPDELVGAVASHFRQRFAQEFIRLCGGDPGLLQVSYLCRDTRFLKLSRNCFNYYQTILVDSCYDYEAAETEWDFAQLWSDNPPTHLVPLRTYLAGLIPRGEVPAWSARCAFLSKPRSNLYYGRLGSTVSKAERDYSRDGQIASLELLVCSEVAHGRRHSIFLPPNSITRGFAVSSEFSLVIFSMSVDGPLLANVEWSVLSGPMGDTLRQCASSRVSLNVVYLAATELHICSNGSTMILPCAVSADFETLRT